MQQRSFDAIVVGSGMTGGWAAKELTEHGLDTLVLEAGPPIDPDGAAAPRSAEVAGQSDPGLTLYCGRP